MRSTRRRHPTRYSASADSRALGLVRSDSVSLFWLRASSSTSAASVSGVFCSMSWAARNGNAAGLSVAIPTVVMHRYFQRKVDTIVVEMEQETIKLVDAMHGDRKVEIK